MAENTATLYGKQLADSKFTSTLQEKGWFLTTWLYRLIMRHRTISKATLTALVASVDPALALKAPGYIDWLTDVTDPMPGECMSQLGWDSMGLAVPDFLEGWDGDLDWDDVTDLIDGSSDFRDFLVAFVRLFVDCPGLL